MFLSSLPGFDKKVARNKRPVVLDFLPLFHYML